MKKKPGKAANALYHRYSAARRTAARVTRLGHESCLVRIARRRSAIFGKVRTFGTRRTSVADPGLVAGHRPAENWPGLLPAENIARRRSVTCGQGLHSSALDDLGHRSRSGRIGQACSQRRISLAAGLRPAATVSHLRHLAMRSHSRSGRIGQSCAGLQDTRNVRIRALC